MEERTSRSRKQKIRLIAGLFVVLLAGFTLAGNSLRALSMPKVYTTVTAMGEIAHRFEGSGTVEPGEERSLANPAGWKVADVLVKQGDRVHHGQPLIEYDDGDALQQLADLQADLKKLNLSMAQLHANFIEAANGGDASAKISAGNAIETAKLDIATQQQHIENLQQSIAGNKELTAPFDGIVMQVNAVAGLLSGGLPDVVVSNSGKGFQIQLSIPGDLADLLDIGETLDQITPNGQDNQQLSGTISAIEADGSAGSPDLTADGGPDPNLPASPPSKLTVTIKNDGLRGGERVKVTISKSGSEQTVTVPNEAIHKDERGAFVYTLREENGPLGNAYYAVETPVTVIDSNAYETAVGQELFEQQEVIINSTGFLMDGERVRR